MKGNKFRTAEQALSQSALQTIADMKVEDFVKSLRQRGITSLDDLAKASIGAARGGLGAAVAFDPEDFPVCYKFTVRPHVGEGLTDLGIVLDKVKNAQFGH